MTFESFYVLGNGSWFIRDCEGGYAEKPSMAVRFSAPEHAQRYADALYWGQKLEIIKVSVAIEPISQEGN